MLWQLEPIHIAIMKIFGDGEEVMTTKHIAYHLPIEAINEYYEKHKPETRLDRRRSNFKANRAGPILAVLAKKGFIAFVDRRPPHTSAWRLGPMSDKLKEEGKL